MRTLSYLESVRKPRKGEQQGGSAEGCALESLMWSDSVGCESWLGGRVGAAARPKRTDW